MTALSELRVPAPAPAAQTTVETTPRHRAETVDQLNFQVEQIFDGATPAGRCMVDVPFSTPDTETLADVFGHVYR